MPKTTAEDRFWSRVHGGDVEQCWQWLGGRNGDGYGSFSVGGRNVRAHRFAYEALRAPIPAGLHIDHLCRNRGCVNPWHLEPVTNRVNVLRGNAGRHMQVKAASKTHCPHGHLFTPETTRMSMNGKRGKEYRHCRTCERAGRKLALNLTPFQREALRLLAERTDNRSPDPGVLTSGTTFADSYNVWVHWKTAQALHRRGLVTYAYIGSGYDGDNTSIALTEAGWEALGLAAIEGADSGERSDG